MINYELDDGVYSQSTVLIKYLTLPEGQCKHTNVVKKSKLDNDAQYLFPAITKSITQSGQKILKRVTVVRFMKIQYTIQDLYDFHAQATSILSHPSLERPIHTYSNESGQSNNSVPREQSRTKSKSKKLCIFHKVIGEGNRLAKRNTKNIPKNFCKAFLNHMNNSTNKDNADWQTAMKDFKKIQRKYKNKYNNILMHRILSNPRIGYFFDFFLKEQAEDWIRSSKISDKEVHLEAISIYSNLLNKIVYAQADPSPSDQ